MLAGILLIAASYFFVFSPRSKEYDALKSQTAVLENQVKSLKELDANRAEYEKEIKEMSAKIAEFTAEFPADTKEEDAIFYGHKMEVDEANSISYSSISLGNPEIVTVTSVPGSEEATLSEYTLFRTRNSYVYKASYAGLKNSLLTINDTTDKTTIQAMNASYDAETGLLTGTLELNFFTMIGTEREYSAPALPPVQMGTNNIFGTVK